MVKIVQIMFDIDMPHDCYSCLVRKNLGCKIANASGCLNSRRNEECPLEEIKTEKGKIIVDLRCVENRQVVACEYLAGTRVDFTMEDLTDHGRQILLGLKKDDKGEE